LLALNFSATDVDIPAQVLTFSLTNSPPDAAINPTNGAFTWIPSGPLGTSTNPVTVVVTDSGNPNKLDSKTFNVIAVDLNANTPIAAADGITISWNAISGLTYRVQFKNDLNEPLWNDLPDDIAATNNSAFKVDAAATTNMIRFYRIIALP
jgi:hypothetical protein